MRFSILVLILMIITVGCTTINQNSNVNTQPMVFEVYHKTTFSNFCVMTATSDIGDKKLFNDLDNEFLMLDELFSEPIWCRTNEDCYESLLDQYGYRSMAPEFEPYLNCEANRIKEINFKKS